MSSNLINSSPYLRTSRNFPEEPQPLSVELSRSYVDISEKINVRTIGLYSSNAPSITGNQWFIGTSRKQQTLRQLYAFTTLPATIPHNITLSNINGFVQIYGTFTDGTNWYPIPFTSIVAVANQVQIIVTPTQIQITGGGAAPVSTQGFVVLEWLSKS